MHPANEEDVIGIVGVEQVHIGVGLPGDKKRIYFFLKVVAGLKNSCIFAAA